MAVAPGRAHALVEGMPQIRPLLVTGAEACIASSCRFPCNHDRVSGKVVVDVSNLASREARIGGPAVGAAAIALIIGEVP